MKPSILRPLLLVLLVTAVALPAHAAPPSRPQAGTGVLLLRPFTPERAAELAAIPIYQEPGVGRIAEFAARKLPQLSPFLSMPAGTYAVAVMEKRGNRLRIAYEGSGRTGWLERARWWDYLSWEEYLAGGLVKLLPGLKAESYRLCAAPADKAPQLAPLSPKTALWVAQVQGDWLQAALPPATTGWLRWRDSDGRLMVRVAEQIPPQNY